MFKNYYFKKLIDKSFIWFKNYVCKEFIIRTYCELLYIIPHLYIIFIYKFVCIYKVNFNILHILFKVFGWNFVNVLNINIFN